MKEVTLLSEHLKNSEILKSINNCIYLIHNLINNKVYIGQTINMWERIPTHIYDSKKVNKPLSKSIRKHGLNNFKVYVLEKDLDKKEMDIVETAFISTYKSYDREFGYNVLKEAKTPKGIKHTFEAINKIKETWNKSNYRENISNKVREQWKNEEWKKDILEKRKKSMSTSEYKQRRSEISRNTYKRDCIRNERKVCQLDIKTLDIIETFNSIKEAEIKTGISRGDISNCCRGKRRNVGGYKWRYENENLKLKEDGRKGRTVLQINKETNDIIDRFDFIIWAARKNNISVSAVYRCCNNQKRTVGGLGKVGFKFEE
jgi:group I intron endonuclease